MAGQEKSPRKQPSRKHDQKVLFVHGLESTPYGFKYQHLKKKFKHVLSVSMYTGIINCKRNSFLVALLREPSFYKFMGSLVVFLYFAFYVVQNIGNEFQWKFYLLSIPSVIFWIRKEAMVREMRWDMMVSIINNCMEIQAQAIKKFEPDVIVSSSFGAAVVVYGILEQRFSAPIVLCASAHELVNKEMFDYWMKSKRNENGKAGLKIPADLPVVIIHGTKDSTVPFQHSRRLYSILNSDKERVKLKTFTKYHEIPDEGHRLRSILSMESSIKRGQTLLETSVLECINSKQV
jgi:hypothetical protein